MKIKLLDIKGFGKFNQLRIEPNEGFNIIFENNESEKQRFRLLSGLCLRQKGGRNQKTGVFLRKGTLSHGTASNMPGSLNIPWITASPTESAETLKRDCIFMMTEPMTLRQAFPEQDTGPQFAEEHLGIDEAALNAALLFHSFKAL